MAGRKWKKFNFFDLRKEDETGELAKYFKDDIKITATAAGNKVLLLGDSVGLVHQVSKKWEISTFRAYQINLRLMQHLRNSTLLITIGEDEEGINPLIKVWDMNRTDKNGMPYCSRITRAIPNNRPVQANALCVHENKQLMAVGFEDGSLVLFRGDVTRDRGTRQKVLREDQSSAVTGLAFKSIANVSLLFVTTQHAVFFYNVTHKDKEFMSRLDEQGCEKDCCVLAESLPKRPFMVASNKYDAIYCYSADGRASCYPAEGEKVLLNWFRSYLVIVSKGSRLIPSKSGPVNQPCHVLTVLDAHHKFTVFSALVDEIKAVFCEGGGFYILDTAYQVYKLVEKDLQAKLSLLFKKNLYDVAIVVAKSQQYDDDQLVDLFRQYGDHLYGNGDPVGAIEQYIKTVGKLEPSYVIGRFMDSKHIDKLTAYLEALHKQGQANEDNTTLLLNCFTKLNMTDSLKEFISRKDYELDFDVNVVIKVCRQSSPEDALMLSKKHKQHDWYIKLLIEDHHRYTDVIEYLSTLDLWDAMQYTKKYGSVLIQHAPHEATQFLKTLCTADDSNPEDYIHLFLSNTAKLVEFLDYLIDKGAALSSPVYDTLLEHYLHIWKSLPDSPEKEKYAQKSLKLMQNPDIKYDKQQALVVCHEHGFSDGILYLYEEQKLYQQILRYHMSKSKENFDANAVLACCERFGHQEPTLWVQAFWSCIRDLESVNNELLSKVLSVIAKDRLLSPQMVVEALATGKAQIKVGQIRDYIINEVNRENEIAHSEAVKISEYKKDTEVLRRKVDALKNEPFLIKASRCASCLNSFASSGTQLPVLHFLCQHSYHQHCFLSYSENENECLACQQENKKVIDLLKAQEQSKGLNEVFHSLLEKEPDGYTLVAEYFGRGVFNTVKVITEEKPKVKPKKAPVAVTEGRLRIEENIRSSPGVIPAPPSEGRIRVQEKKYSALEPSVSTKAPKVEEISDYDPKKDPFHDDYEPSKDPFHDDYEPELEYKEYNPFEMDE